MSSAEGAPWASGFQIDGDPSGHVVLEQMDGNAFELGSTTTYIGEQTGLERKLDPSSSTRSVGIARTAPRDRPRVRAEPQDVVEPPSDATPPIDMPRI